MTTRTLPIIVGVDGSKQGSRALDWAIDEARRRTLPLHLVHAWMWPLLHVPLDDAPGGPDEDAFRLQGELILTDASAEAARLAPDLLCTAELVVGAPAAALAKVSARGATMTVVGSRGMGGFAGLLVGSCSVELSGRTRGPLVVVRGEPAPPSGSVLVGVDESDSAHQALAIGFEEAALRNVPLVAVQVIDPPAALYGIAAGMAEMLESAREAAKAGLAAAVAAAAKQHPDVEVTTKVVLGSPGGVLAAESDGAAMLVVGSRGRSGLASMVLGSTSHAVLHHSHCPVVVCAVNDQSGP